MDLREIGRILWIRRWYGVAFFVLTMLAAGVYAYATPKRYESSVTLAVEPVLHGNGFFVQPADVPVLLATFASEAQSDATKSEAAVILRHPFDSDIRRRRKPTAES